MKLAKLSLAAIVVAGLASSSFAASDTLADAFKNGKINGELRAWYFDRDTGRASESLFTTGVDLTYVTDTLYGFSLGLTVQSSYSPFANDAEKSMYKTDMYGSGAVLSEAYIAYTIGKTTAKVGRQYISTPLVGGSGTRMIKEAFEGAVVVNTDLPQTTLAAGYVDKFQGRTSTISGNATGDTPNFEKTAIFYGVGSSALSFNDAYTILAINKSIPNLTITGQYALVTDVSGSSIGDVDVYYAGLGYVVPMDNFKVGLDGALQKSSTEAATTYEGNMKALQASLIDLAGFGAKIAYTTTSKDDNVILGMGNGSGAVAFTAPLIKVASAVSGHNTDAYKVEASYDFAKVGVTGLTMLAQYINVNLPSAAPTGDQVYLEGQVAYAIPSLKGLTISAEYENIDNEKSADANEFRFRANYKF